MVLFDTHAHVNFNAFKDDADTVLKRALENNTWVVMPGTQFSTSKKAVEMAERYPQGVYAAIGLHPIHLAEKRRVDVMEVQSEQIRQTQGKEPDWMLFETKAEEFDYERYKRLALSDPLRAGSRRVVAIGECGLDYYYEPKGKENRESQRRKQNTALALQLKLADELNLPVILHCRKAHDDLIEFLKSYKLQAKSLRGVVHCYTGDLKQAEQFYNLGLYFGFNGLIFKNVPALPDPAEIIGAIPLDRIVLETDSPYLIPPSARRLGLRSNFGEGGSSSEGGLPVERNEPLFVKYVAEEIARIKNIKFEEVARVTTENAKKLFGIMN